MKKLLFTLCSIILFSSCRKDHSVDETQSVCITVVADTTDPHALLPVPDPILSIYDFNNDKEKEASFRFNVITDRQLNSVISYHLANGSTTDKENKRSDPHYREKLILAFYDAIRRTLSDFTTACTTAHSMEHSECYRTIVSELHLLTQSKAKEKIILIFSNLMENSDLFSVYSKANFKLLKVRPEIIAERLQKTFPLPQSLKGIKIYFVFQPRSRSEDTLYRSIENVYELLLKPLGAIVTVQANNKSFTE